MTADLSGPIRAALLASSSITARLPAYKGSLAIFTRRPVPADAPYPMIVVSPDITVTDEDGLSDMRPLIERDVAVYGRNDTAEKYRTVEELAYNVRTLFHRQRHVLTVSGWSTAQIIARGPRPAPVDDDQTVGRVVTLTIRLAED